ncbi:YbgC/FadM family acyl-CoA thioesterase [Aquicella lusitana]|uniref:Acyl-CoA thioester hydrolase n=1 Tax=Aquicella lusitana TaxID=254246 RepID=A0A370GDC4_9COXI|nr:YbgC/FadM family acyl-CoA thioesterase [Aquicella lusitana]RDI41825.1 acyl-CoA thioester hydrolase [Aquicella lusitana]VVC73733.1 Acyl-CoA thioesterase YbgC [Aquicella lusitana]
MQNQFTYLLRIHIEDTDFAGVVYHSNYLKFMERARSEWAEQVGLGMTWQREHQIYFPVHAAHILFLKPARVHDKVEVVTSIKAVRPASLVYEQYLRLAHEPDKMLCKAEIKIACVDLDMRPRAIPYAPFLEMIRRELT